MQSQGMMQFTYIQLVDFHFWTWREVRLLSKFCNTFSNQPQRWFTKEMIQHISAPSD